MRRSSWARALPWIVGPVLLALSGAYLASFDWRRSWSVLAAFDPLWGVAAAGGTIVVFLHVRTLRWRLLLAHFGVRVPWGRLYLATSIGLTLATVTPLQSGELTKVEVLRRVAPVERLPAYSAMAVERMLDLGCVLALAIGGWLGVREWSGLFPQLPWIAPIGLLLLVAGALALGKLPLGGRLAEMQRSFSAILGRPAVGLSTAGLTLLSWLLVAAGWYSALRSVGLDTGGVAATALTAFVTLVNVASLLPGAVGVSEASSAGVLRSLGTPPAQALAGALMIRFHGLLLLAIGVAHLAALLAWRRGRWRRPAAP